MKINKHNLLGTSTPYPQTYSPDLLTPVSRTPNREKLGILNQLPFFGVDIWNAWEMSWLNTKGKPLVAIGTIEIPCESNNIVESKSLKLYLNSLNQTRFSSGEALSSVICRDLSTTVGSEVGFSMLSPDNWRAESSIWADAVCLDALDIECTVYPSEPSVTDLRIGDALASELLCSHLLKTNCPVTGQPDWATIYIQYYGRAIDHKGLLRFIVSLRNHQDFHEHCVETIFMAISERCRPEKLAVYARYTRRGGIDINPFRSNFQQTAGNTKLARQ